MHRRSACRNLLCFLLVWVLVAITSIKPSHADVANLDKFGVADHPHWYNDYNAACDEIIASGIKWVRISPHWGSLEPSSGAYDAAQLAKLDAIVNKLTSNNVNVVFILCYTAEWASSQPGPNAPWYKPSNWGYWSNYVNTICTRYNNKITHWEVWNEPDHIGFWKSTPADYVTLLQHAATEIRAVNPNNKILMAGLATFTGTVESYGFGSFFDVILGLGAANYFDIVNYHSYGNNTRYVTVHKAMRDVMTAHNIQSRRMWITETGYTTEGDSAKEPIKADMVDQTYLTHINLTNVDRVFWYVHRSTNFGGAFEDNFGLTNNSRTPLKAFYHHNASGGAETDFRLETSYPTLVPTRRTLNYFPATAGDGSFVTNYVPDGSQKKIPASKYMYLRLNDNWLYDGNGGLDSKVYVDVTYLNTGTGNWSLQYDANSNAYYNTGTWRVKTNTGTWLTETFTLTDVKFANRQNNAADLRLFAGSADLIVSSVRVRKEMDHASIAFGSPDKVRLAERFDDLNPAAEGYAPAATVGGRSCRQITGNGKFIYTRVNDGLIRAGHANVKLDVTFWDAGTDNLRVEYSALSSLHKPVTITKTNTNAWRTVTLTFSDANFNNGQNYLSDFRISNNFDGSIESIAKVEAYRY